MTSEDVARRSHAGKPQPDANMAAFAALAEARGGDRQKVIADVMAHAAEVRSNPPTRRSVLRYFARRVTVGAQRGTSRAPRSRPASKPATKDSGGQDPPEPPAGPLVHQGSSGLPRRRYLALVRDKGIRHARIGRLVVVRLDDLYRALGLGDAAPTAPAAPTWSPEALRLRILAGGKAGAR
jgi:hypothetical protein